MTDAIDGEEKKNLKKMKIKKRTSVVGPENGNRKQGVDGGFRGLFIIEGYHCTYLLIAFYGATGCSFYKPEIIGLFSARLCGTQGSLGFYCIMATAVCRRYCRLPHNPSVRPVRGRDLPYVGVLVQVYGNICRYISVFQLPAGS